MARGATRTGGQALIEFALILPLLFLLILNLVNFSTYIYACITVANATRAGAQYMVMGGAWANSPQPPNAALVESVVRLDASSLPSPLLRQAGRLHRCTQGTLVFWRVQDF
jgi:hypothetical protein